MGKNVLALAALLLLVGIGPVLSPAIVLEAEEPLSLPEVIEYSMQHNGELNPFVRRKGLLMQGRSKRDCFQIRPLILKRLVGR